MDTRDLTLDHLDAILDIRRRSFGPLSPSERELWLKAMPPIMAEGRYLGVFDGDRLAAAGRIRAFTQWWHGRPQPMAGVAGVTVNPEDRGRGVGTTLMTALIDRAADLGDAVSALYPATTPIYRSLGYEHAGAQNLITLPADALRRIRHNGQVKLRRMGPDDAPELLSVIGRAHAESRASGPITWDERTWRVWLAEEDDFLYLADDGYAVYRWSDGDLEVDAVVAASEETGRALWSLIGSASSIARHVTAAVAPDDPVLWLTGERTKETAKQVRWMHRLIDLPLAVARRGYPSALTASALLEVEDAQRPGNSGAWRLEVSGGSGTATAAGGPSREAARLGAGGMAALYAGVPTATLRRAGLLAGPDEADETLDAVFAGRPYMLDYF
ncbi:GNAT family N-acetyltransferase [Nonomuraea typhae]|uniref:GNAT family N-acetyltransferase n=1 Tax=Nonomuraea typhae TaxID=2603600 RepID=UPI001FE8B102|nr:GNAT family N-acetyltransferase [Nonomuraea typhae]